MRKFVWPVLLAAMLMVSVVGGAQEMAEETFRVIIENVSDPETIGEQFVGPISPGVYTVTDENAPLFTVGEADRGEGLEGIAEDGNPSGYAGVPGVVIFNTPDGASAAGPAFPGGSYSFIVTASPGEALYFSTMFVQSNDLFYAPDEAGIALFDTAGEPISGDVTDQVELWDAGTEVNEDPGVGENQAPRQAGPDTGEDEMGTVLTIDAVEDGFTYPPVDDVIRVTVMPVDVQVIDLPGEALFPEGILAAPNGDLYVTGFGNGSILRVVDGTTVETFKEPGADGLSSAVGLQLDAANNRLWVANFAFDGLTSDMKVYDLETGELLASIPDGSDTPHFFNEVVIDAAGRVYISDTMAPVIWTIDSDLGAAEVFVEDELLANPDPERPFGLNGLAMTPDGSYLIASVMDRLDQGGGRLVRVDLASAEVTEITLNGAEGTVASFGGSDGMFFEDGLLWMVNVTPPASILTAAFNEDYTAAELTARDAFEAAYNRPTSSTVRGGRLWTVNSQLDHVIDDANGALNTPPDLPFQIVGVPLEGLLAAGE